MDLELLIAGLSDPAAYPERPGQVEVRHTHISVVFLVGPHVYKVKKPVNLGFLDFSTLEKRRHYCEEEVRLNRRLAPSVYLDVVPITRTGDRAQVEGRGEVLEWAVKMVRLPDNATLRHLLLHGDPQPSLLAMIADRLATFHRQAERGPHIADFGRFNVVARNARENFEQSAPHAGITVHPDVLFRVRALCEQSLQRLQPLIEARAQRGVPRDTHGDLHSDHVYLFPERALPDDLVMIDCIEFNERFRFADPVADMAFLAMDLARHGRRDLALSFAEAYFDKAGDAEGRALLPFYIAYRAAVRAKVNGFKWMEKEVPEAEHAAALDKARAHWLLALGELEDPGRKPCLLLVGGLPGTGKSTLARGLAERAGLVIVRSDQVRKELAGPVLPQKGGLDEGLYSPEWTERTYAECLRRAEEFLFAGRRVIVDATFGQERQRRLFLDAAVRWGVPGWLLLCRTDPEIARERIGKRHGDLSDADWGVHVEAARRWEDAGQRTESALRIVDTNGTSEEALNQGLQWLAQAGLLRE